MVLDLGATGTKVSANGAVGSGEVSPGPAAFFVFPGGSAIDATNGRGPHNAYVEKCPGCQQPIFKCYPVHREIIHIPDVHSRPHSRNCKILVTIKAQTDIDRRPCHRCNGEGCDRCDQLGEVGKATAVALPPGVDLEQARKHFRVGPYRRSDEV